MDKETVIESLNEIIRGDEYALDAESFITVEMLSMGYTQQDCAAVVQIAKTIENKNRAINYSHHLWDLLDNYDIAKMLLNKPEILKTLLIL